MMLSSLFNVLHPIIKAKFGFLLLSFDFFGFCLLFYAFCVLLMISYYVQLVLVRPANNLNTVHQRTTPHLVTSNLVANRAYEPLLRTAMTPHISETVDDRTRPEYDRSRMRTIG